MAVARPSVHVRRERPGDEAAIRAVHDAAFGGLTEGQIVDDMRGAKAWIAAGSLVAEDARRVVGHLLLSRARVVGRDGSIRTVGLIGPVGVLPELQRRGIGAALMHAAEVVATRLGLPAVCLVGHADYYPRFGFTPARAIGLEPPRPWPDANWLARPLPAWTSDLQGRVQLPSAFPEE